MRYINLRFTYLLTYLNLSTGIKTRLTKVKQKTSLIDQLCEVGEDVRSKDGVSRPLFCVFVVCCGGETTGRRSVISISGWSGAHLAGRTRWSMDRCHPRLAQSTRRSPRTDDETVRQARRKTLR